MWRIRGRKNNFKTSHTSSIQDDDISHYPISARFADVASQSMLFCSSLSVINRKES
jgi:hypothetical protein